MEIFCGTTLKLVWPDCVFLHTHWHAAAESTDVTIVISSPQNETVDVSSTVFLVCVAHGNPAPSIGWQLDDTTVTNATSCRV